MHNVQPKLVRWSRQAFARLGEPSGIEPVLVGLREAVMDPRPVPERSARPADDGRVLIPEEPVSMTNLIAELRGLLDGAAGVGGSGWLAHMDPAPTWGSVLGAAAAALLNNNMLMPELSPSLTELETRMTAAFAREFGLGPHARGTFTAGGSLGNLLALTVARNRRLARSTSEGTSRGDALSSLSVVASSDAHTSIHRAAMILGLDTAAGVLEVAPGPDGALDPTQVLAQMRSARTRGRDCFAVVATAGTTVLGAIDPLESLAAVARKHDAWYHVDAAYAGALVLSDKRRRMLDGIGEADSVVVNPQKWLYVAKVCALALFRDGQTWADGMGGSLPYAKPGSVDEPAPVAQIEGTRHADVLKLYLGLRQIGRRGYEDVFEHSFQLARQLEAEIGRRDFLELAAPAVTNIVVFRCRTNASHPATPTRTEKLHRRLAENANVQLSLPSYRGDRWLRAVVLNPFVTTDTLGRLFAEIDAFAVDERLA